jgi:hypothetical protein
VHKRRTIKLVGKQKNKKFRIPSLEKISKTEWARTMQKEKRRRGTVDVCTTGSRNNQPTVRTNCTKKGQTRPYGTVIKIVMAVGKRKTPGKDDPMKQ